MRRRLGLVATLLFLIGLTTPTPSARAAMAGGFHFFGAMSFSSGISNSCFGNGAVDITKCPLVGGTNVAGMFFGANLVGGMAHGPTKGAKANTAEAGTFGLSLTGTVHGSCDLFSAQLSGSLSPTLSLGTKAKHRTVQITISNIFNKMVISGSTDKGETVFGFAQWVPDTAGGSSCFNKQAKNFFTMGDLSIARL